MQQSSDESDDEPFTPPTTFEAWFDSYFSALEELYSLFLQEGRYYFGEAFFQFGNIENFARHIYTRTTL